METLIIFVLKYPTVYAVIKSVFALFFAVCAVQVSQAAKIRSKVTYTVLAVTAWFVLMQLYQLTAIIDANVNVYSDICRQVAKHMLN